MEKWKKLNQVVIYYTYNPWHTKMKTEFIKKIAASFEQNYFKLTFTKNIKGWETGIYATLACSCALNGSTPFRRFTILYNDAEQMIKHTNNRPWRNMTIIDIVSTTRLIEGNIHTSGCQNFRADWAINNSYHLVLVYLFPHNERLHQLRFAIRENNCINDSTRQFSSRVHFQLVTKGVI